MLLKQLQNKNISILNCIAIIAVTMITFICLHFYSEKHLEPKAYDFLMCLTSSQEGSKDIVNIVIDDESLYEIGRWPWKRTIYTDLFEFFENHTQAQAIIFDSIIISAGDKANDEEFFKRISKLNKLSTGINFEKINNKEIKELHNKKLKSNFELNLNDKRRKSLKNRSKYYNQSNILPEYLQKVNAVGAVTVRPDSDGIIRKIEPVINYQDKYYPSLALSALLKTSDIKKFDLKNKSLEIFYSNEEKKVLPIDSQNGIFAYLKWYKPYDNNSLSAHKNYSAWKIIKSYKNIQEGKKPIIDPNEFNKKIIVIGATAAALHDIKTTPIGANYPGVDIQSTFIDNLINNDIIEKSPHWLNMLVLITAVALVWLIINLLNPLYSSIAFTLLMFAYFYIAIFSYSNNYAINVITPYVFVIFTLVAGYAYRYFSEGYKKEQMQVIMGKYVSKDLVENIMQNMGEVKPGGKKEEITVLFADIRGFTKISEVLEPDEVTVLLNEYFAEMLPIIEKHNGVVNKFMGDALLTIFGEPIKDKNHPRHAILCAYEMVEKVQQLREKWKKEGKPKIDIGIGINTGVAFIGNIGTQDRLEYTVIGDTVNVASRIESQNRLFNTKLLISESTYKRAEDLVDVIKISSVEIKGRKKSIDIYEILKMLDKPTSTTKLK